MTHAPTGTGPQRRRLTDAEAQAGIAPEPFTREEWAAMHEATATMPGPMQWSDHLHNLFRAVAQLFKRHP